MKILETKIYLKNGHIIDVGETVDSADFIFLADADPTPANDEGKVPKLEANGKMSKHFLPFRTTFGGDGSDGALSVSSGTTSIDMGGARYYEKNYTSISITGTGKVEFINPHADGTVVVIRCQGNATLTSSSAPMLSVEGCGASGGTGGTRSTTGGNTDGTDGSDGKTYGFLQTDRGLGSSQSSGGGAVGTFGFMGGVSALHWITQMFPKIFVGAGGGGGQGLYSSGGSGSVKGGKGGKGGGALVLLIDGAINFTTTNGISVAGQNGYNGEGAISGSPSNYMTAGGGAGGGGCAFILYRTETAFTGTVKVSGGTGGNSVGTFSSANGGSGGGSATNTGSNYSNAGNGAKSGGDGGAGLEYHAVIKDFVSFV